MSELRAQISASMKDAMRNKEKDKLTTIRSLQAALKQIEVDERIEPDDARILAVLDKLIKQRKDSATQFRDAERVDLAEQEEKEMLILQAFLPQALSADEVDALITAAIADVGEQGMQAMGKVMAQLKPKLQGRADIGAASARVKAALS